LISDAGTPGICDPGTRLAAACIEHGLPFTSIPGPNAALTALVLSGLTTQRFQFLGFLPKKSKEIKSLFEELLHYPGTTIVYESPHRLIKTLQLLHTLDPSRNIAIARELTKLHEECLRGAVGQLLPQIEKTAQKGEYVLLIEGKREFERKEWPEIPEHVEELQREGLSKAEAIKKAAELRGVPKREIYNTLHKLSK